MNLTDKQYEILVYIKKYIAKNEKSPTIREIQANFNLKSPSTIHGHIKGLEKKGIIYLEHNKSRSIKLLVENEYKYKDDSMITIPIIDNIYYGNYSKDYLSIPKTFFEYNTYDDICAFIKDNKTIYFINKDLNIQSDEYISLINNKLVVSNDKSDATIGVIIGKFIKK